jgi:hypothetical protein
VASRSDDSDRIVCSENFQVEVTLDLWLVTGNLWHYMNRTHIASLAGLRSFDCEKVLHTPVVCCSSRNTPRMYLETNVADVMTCIMPAFEAVVRGLCPFLLTTGVTLSACSRGDA